MDRKTFNILAIDGGGIRGVFPAHILQCIEERLNVNLLETFDMIAGTSTGSIIAAGVACEIAPSNIVDLYREKGEKIFVKKNPFVPSKPSSIFYSIYESVGLEEALKDVLGEIKLGDIDKPLILPSTDIGNGSVHVFKSNYSKEFTRDRNVLLREAVAASCSAPIYFDPSKIDSYLLADGGVWANNPSLAAVIDAKRRLGVNMEEIKILSLGTGHSKTAYGVDTNKNWGFLNGWGGKEFISFLLSLQAQSTNNYLQLLLNQDQLLRIDFESDKPLPLDDLTKIDDLISRADKEFTHRSKEINNFLIDNKGV
jgi:patatin-like phospholipase/acyl hydrolase